jgi:hypothetical protein
MDFHIIPKDVKEINLQLVDHFGIDTDTGNAIWRVAWSKDQFENRLSKYTPGGVELLYPLIQRLPKYQHIDPSCWILERLCLIPEINKEELPEMKKSYECMYAFEEVTPNPPSFEACKFVVDTVYAALGKSSMRKYIDEEEQNPVEARVKRVSKIEEELFGDESSVLLGRTITGEAVAYTGEPKIKPASQEK